MREKRVNQSQKTKELKDVENLHRAEEKCRVSSNIPFQKFAKFGIKKRIACLILALKQQFFCIIIIVILLIIKVIIIISSNRTYSDNYSHDYR